MGGPGVYVCRNGKVKKQRRQPVTLLQNETFFLSRVSKLGKRGRGGELWIKKYSVPLRSSHSPATAKTEIGADLD